MERILKNLTDSDLMDYIKSCESYNDSSIVDEQLQKLNDNIGSFLSVTTGEIYREAALRWKKRTEIINNNKNEVDEYIRNWESSYLL